jgi:hypothetical protein
MPGRQSTFSIGRYVAERASIVTVVDPTPAIIYYLHFAGSSMYSRTTCILQVDGESGQ